MSSFLSYKRSKLKLRVFLAGHIVAMVTYCATNLTATCLPVIGQFFDTLILASTDIEWLMKFLAIESLRISLKLNISAAREQQAVGLGPLM